MNEFLNKIIHDDALSFLSKIKSASVDLVCTDVPYNVLNEKWDTFEMQDFEDFTLSYLQEFYRVLKNNTACYIFWSQKHIALFHKLIDKTQFKLERMLIWHHPNLCIPTRKAYLYSYDPIFYLTKGKPKFDAEFTLKENVDVFNFAKPQSNFKEDKRIHLCQKPVKLIETLIKPTTKPQDVVLDPFMGSGTSAIASLNLDRNFLGCEMVLEYVNLANERLNEARKNKGNLI